jgi:MFS family permease
VIIGLGVAALLLLFAVPNATNKVDFIPAIGAFGLFDIAALWATMELMRGFIPQFGRAAVMGFWALGPVAGLVLANEVTDHTVGPTSGDWQRAFIVAGVAGLVAFGVALVFLRELSPQLARVTYGVARWSEDQRAALTEALKDAGVPYEWDARDLVVERRFEDVVDEFIYGTS